MKKEKESLLLVSVNNFYGGGEVHLRNLAQLLQDSYEIHTLVFDPALAASLESVGVTVHRLSFFPRAMRLFQVLHAFCALPALIYKNRVRGVVVGGTIETLLLLPAKLIGCRTISMRHMLPFLGRGSIFRRGRRLIIEAVYGLGILFADQVVCVSEAIAEGMRKIALHKRIVVIPNWAPSVPEMKNRQKLRSPVRLLFVGRLELIKGLHVLLGALKNASNYELTVVGDGVEAAQLQKAAYGMAVRFEGFQSDTAKYYREADIFVMPSLGPEGLPLVTLEAMSHTLPCILSDIPAHVDISCDGEAAWLFENGQVESLRTKLHTLFQSNVERVALGERGYRRIVQNYSPAVAKEAYLKILAGPR